MVIARVPGIDRSLVARIGGDMPLAVGERCRLHMDVATVHVFDDTGVALSS
jgi:hypothetical protein